MIASAFNYRLVVAILPVVVLVWLSLGCQADGGGCSQTPYLSEPIRVMDDTGRVFRFVEPPQRIAALSSFSLEMLMALGRTPVARFDAPSQYPPESELIPVISRSYRTGPSIDELKAQKPDLIVLHPIYASFVQPVEEAVGAPAMVLNVKSIDEVGQKLELFGRLVGQPDTAKAMVADIEFTLCWIDSRASKTHQKPVAISLLGREDRWYAHRGDHFMGSLLDAADAVNTASDDPADKRYRSLAPIDLEQLALKDPDVIFIIPYSEDDAQVVINNFNNDLNTQTLRAVKNGRVHVLPDTIYTRQPGPRTGRALQTLYMHLYPDAQPSKR